MFPHIFLVRSMCLKRSLFSHLSRSKYERTVVGHRFKTLKEENNYFNEFIEAVLKRDRHSSLPRFLFTTFPSEEKMRQI